MKKTFLLVGVLFLSAAAFAYTYEQTAANHVYQEAEQQVNIQEMGRELLAAAQKGKMKQFRELLSQANKRALLVTDDYGRNILHVARNKHIFDLAWAVLDPVSRESLLAQRNKAGETPLMAHIVFGHEQIFLSYFPQTQLYQRLQKTTAGLNSVGLARQSAEIERAELIRECSVGGVNMWQRAAALATGAHGDSSAASSRALMPQVRDMIGAVAPFLVK